MSARLLGIYLGAAALLFDQLTKALVLAELAAPIRVTGFFDLVLVWNPGISFGMLGGLGAYGPYILTGLAVAVCLVLLVWLLRAESRLVGAALGLVIGGAIGNVVDRVRFGAVVDFLSFHAGGFYWPAFNLADSAICVGAALLLLSGLTGGDAERRPSD